MLEREKGVKNIRKQITEPFVSKQRVFLILVVTIVTITIVSKSSPLYPFNDGVDVNAFMTMGRSLLYGKVPYKDLYDHKGPFLYVIYLTAVLISETSFIGVWLWEIVACFFFLLFSYKIIEDCSKTLSLLFIPVLAAVVYGSAAFLNGGLVEEFSLPIFAYAIYIGFEMLDDKRQLKNSSSLIIGITSGILFWMKFNLCMFYLGWIFAIACVFIKRHRIKELIKMCFLILAGIVLVTVPLIIYFAANNGLNDLFKVYFYDNMFTYSEADNRTLFKIIKNIFVGFESNIIWNLASCIYTLVGLIFLFIHSKRKFLLTVCSFLSMGVGIYCGMRSSSYYTIAFSVFAPLIMESVRNLKLKDNEQRFLQKNKKYIIAFLSIVSILFIYINSPNIYLMKYKKTDMPQFQFAEIISNVEDATLLEYDCMDLGFYTACGIVPVSKYYYKPNMEINELYEEQKEIIENGSVDFIVAMDELDADLYKCVASADFLFWDGGDYTNHYYLYQLITD